MFSHMNDTKKCRICVIFVVWITLEMKNIVNCVEDVASLESGVSTLEYIVYWKESVWDKILNRLTLPKISSLKYAPVTSCHVKRLFSMFKNVLSYKHMSLNKENLEKLVVHCFRKNKYVT